MFALLIRVGIGLGANVQSRDLLSAPCLQIATLSSIPIENSPQWTIFLSIGFRETYQRSRHKGPQKAMHLSVMGKMDLHVGGRGAVETFP